MLMKMMMRVTAALAAIFLLSGFSIHPDERSLQDSLPQSKDKIWAILDKCTVYLNEEEYLYSVEFTPEVKAMEGKKMTVSGFMLPLESTEKFTHFLLSKRTPTCGFCPPGEPTEMIEVFTKEPVTWVEDSVTVTGVMTFSKEPELGVFFQLLESDSQ